MLTWVDFGIDNKLALYRFQDGKVLVMVQPNRPPTSTRGFDRAHHVQGADLGRRHQGLPGGWPRHTRRRRRVTPAFSRGAEGPRVSCSPITVMPSSCRGGPWPRLAACRARPGVPVSSRPPGPRIRRWRRPTGGCVGDDTSAGVDGPLRWYAPGGPLPTLESDVGNVRAVRGRVERRTSPPVHEGGARRRCPLAHRTWTLRIRSNARTTRSSQGSWRSRQRIRVPRRDRSGRLADPASSSVTRRASGSERSCRPPH